MNIDMLIDGILDSYDRYGGINRTGAENFPNRENVIAVLNELQTLVFPGFKNAEDITPTNIRYITGHCADKRDSEGACLYGLQEY